MRSVKGKNTSPELKVRKLLLAANLKGYRLHRKDVPGCPDIAFMGRRKAIFVHGGFWHGHKCPRGRRIPTTNADYWVLKIAKNVKRDSDSERLMAAQGWRFMVVWECELKDLESLSRKLRVFLESSK